MNKCIYDEEKGYHNRSYNNRLNESDYYNDNYDDYDDYDDYDRYEERYDYDRYENGYEDRYEEDIYNKRVIYSGENREDNQIHKSSRRNGISTDSSIRINEISTDSSSSVNGISTDSIINILLGQRHKDEDEEKDKGEDNEKDEGNDKKKDKGEDKEKDKGEDKEKDKGNDKGSNKGKDKKSNSKSYDLIEEISEFLGDTILLTLKPSQLNVLGQVFRPIFLAKLEEVGKDYILLKDVNIKMSNAPEFIFPTPLLIPVEQIVWFSPFDSEKRFPLY